MNKNFKHISVSSDEEDVVIQAGAHPDNEMPSKQKPSSEPYRKDSSQSFNEASSTSHQADDTASSPLHTADAEPSLQSHLIDAEPFSALHTADAEPSSASHQADDESLRDSVSTTNDAPLQKGLSSSRLKRSKDKTYHETTLDDLKGTMPKMQKVIIGVAIAAIIVAIVYYLVFMS